MSLGSQTAPFFGGAGAGGGLETLEIERSVRFDTSSYFSKTPTATGNQRKWTFSCWFKRQKLKDDVVLFSAGTSVSNRSVIMFSAGNNDDALYIYNNIGGVTGSHKTDRVFRDCAGWYHFVIAADTDLVDAADRYKLYVNGELQIWSSSTNPINQDTLFNTQNPHVIGANPLYNSTNRFAGHMANVQFIDGKQLEATDFGFTDADTGMWTPAVYKKGYPGNSFYLNFADNSSLTSGSNVGLGKDVSGNGNYFNTTGFSITPGINNDSLFDSPSLGTQTDNGNGGEVSGNYAVFSTLHKNLNSTVSNGGLQCSSTGVNDTLATFRMPKSGKFYWEFYIGATDSGYPAVGIIGQNDTGLTDYSNVDKGVVWFTGGYIQRDGANVHNPVSGLTAGDIVRVAFDGATQSVWMALNGNSWIGGGDPAAGTTPTTTLNRSGAHYCIGASTYNNANVQLNAGQRAFNYQAPTGFKCASTTSLDTPAFVKASSAFDIITYIGDGSGDRSFTTLDFDPGLVWCKTRNRSAYAHLIYDSTRGAGSANEISSNTSVGQGDASIATNVYGYLSSFLTGGFATVQGSVNNDYWNRSASQIAVFNWLKDPSSGVSAVTWTGNGNDANISHGLSDTPIVVFGKSLNATNNWVFFHWDLGPNKTITLNDTAGDFTSTVWNGVYPNDSRFQVNINYNISGRTFVGYAFAPKDGYSAFGSFKANANSDGPYCNCGFKPAFVIIRSTTDFGGGVNWCMLDIDESPYNFAFTRLAANSDAAESGTGANQFIDFTSDGFKIRNSLQDFNYSQNSTYVYMAFADVPTKYSRGH